MEIRPRVLLCDDHALIQKGAVSVLSDRCEIVGLAADGEEAVALAVRLSPDVVVLDISMPTRNGIEAARLIRGQVPDARIIVLSMHNDQHFLRLAVAAGVSAYVLKSDAAEDLPKALAAVSSGRRYFSPALSFVPTGLSSPLTGRQLEIIRLIAQGRANKEISHVLGISPKTVEFHRRRIVERFGVQSIAEAIRFAVERRLFT
jgi:DNA-binding NarL/FixJ family response regulator